MKCLHCGCETAHPLCDSCRTAPILDEVFPQILSYKPDACDNPYLAEYAETFPEGSHVRNCIPEMLDLFAPEMTEYHRCRYLWWTNSPDYETHALAYLDSHPLTERKTQRVLDDLLNRYIRNDFIKPQKWCAQILETDNLVVELYAKAAQFYGMIGEYDLSDQCSEKGLACCEGGNEEHFLYWPRETAADRLEKQKTDTNRYRTKKPYWPTTEERRRAVCMFYDEKGIQHPRIKSMPEKVREDQFEPLEDYDFDIDEPLQDYCAFWCGEAYSLAPVHCIYQIAAVRVRDGQISECFQSRIRPWDGTACRKDGAKKLGIPLEEMEATEDVDQVLPRFFEFAGDDVLVAASALGKQGKLLARAARYAGMAKIPNEICDLLDVAADTDEEFDMEHNTLEYLLPYFKLEESRDTLKMAQANAALYEKLKEFVND